MKTAKQILLLVLLLTFANNIYAQWTITLGPGTANGNTLYRVGETIYAGTDAGAYKSTNNGDNWILINNGFIGSSHGVRDFAYTNQKLWCAAFGSGLYFSTDNGNNWNREYGNLTNGTSVKVTASNSQYVYRNDNSGWIHWTTNNGSNWTIMSQGNYPYGPNSLIINDNLLYAGDYDGFHWSILGGTSWTRVNGNLTGDAIRINKLKYANNKIYIATRAGIWSSTNTGINWTNLNLALSTVAINTLSVLDQNIFIGTSDNLYLSINDGNNWNSIYLGLPTSTTITSIAYNSNYLFVMLQTGIVYRRPLSDFGIIGIQSISSEVPDNYHLSQNYPNPFNPTTNINFNVPKSGFVKITVYDINGREISMPVNQEMTPGSYKVDFDGSSLSSGIYYYTMTGGDFAETKKMMLVK
ncbi:MAG: T9SS type A sorting domain-containing protein [Ignavibacteria bacterium]|nr:T9SS type A sorting domain-containing protein [Ignavibacteria bacterium]